MKMRLSVFSLLFVLLILFLLYKLFHTFHDPFACSLCFDVNVTVVRISDKFVSPLFQFLIQVVQHDVRE